MYDNPWLFNDTPFDTPEIDKYTSFVYQITSLIDGRKYIGRKNFYFLRKEKGKAKRQRKESDWKTYYSSSQILKEQVKEHGPQNFKREILSLHITEGDANRTEGEIQWKLNVLYDRHYINETIGNHRLIKNSIVEQRRISPQIQHLLLNKTIERE